MVAVTMEPGVIGVRFAHSAGLGPQVLAVLDNCPQPEQFPLGEYVVAVDGRDARELTPTEMCEYLKVHAERARTLTLRAPVASAGGDGGGDSGVAATAEGDGL